MERRGRRVVGILSGLVWGIGGAILIQQAGIRSLDPLLLYGLPASAAVVSGLWSARHRAGPATGALMALILPIAIVAQGGNCFVEVTGPDGDTTLFESGADPLQIDDVTQEFSVLIEVPGAEDAGSIEAEVWVEVGGFRIPVRTGRLDGGVMVQSLIPEDDFAPFATPGLYHVGGSADGFCSADGFIRIGGSPFSNPVGQAATGALLLGLLGTWYAGRIQAPARKPADTGRQDDTRAHEKPDTTEPSDLHPPVVPAAVLPPRLEARIFDLADPLTPLAGFVAGATHRVELSLGSLDPALAAALGPKEAPQSVQVVLSGPGLEPQTQIAHLTSAGTVSMNVAAPADASEIDVRLTATAGGRILHTALLPARVTSAAIAAPATAANIAAAETCAIPIASPAPTPFDGAYLVDGGHGLAISADTASVIDFDDVTLNETVDRIRRRLGEIVEEPGDFGALDAAGTVELLIFLAHHGKLLRDALLADHLETTMAAARYIQVASSRPDAYFPFELAYDYAAPGEDAHLCPEASAALAAEAIDISCPGAHDGSTVCPFGFWGVTRVIERHAHQPGERLPAGFVLRSSPTGERSTLSLTASVLFAASARVDAFEPGTVDALAAALTGATSGGVTRVDTWTGWEAAIAAAPSVEVLLPHTVHSDLLDVYGLEIGEGDRRWAGEIDPRLLPGEDRPVLVALLGCETATAGMGYERFPGLFRRAGAEIVLGTLSEVLGRHAAPLAKEIITELYGSMSNQPVPFGELMVRLRRRLLRRGMPMVLAITAYGDADWLISHGNG